MFRIGLLIFAIFLSSFISTAQWKRSYTPLFSGNIIQDKNFYLFTLIQKAPGVNSLLMEQPLISRILKRRMYEVKGTICKADAVCISKSFLWSQTDIDSVAQALHSLAKTDAVIKRLINEHMRPSGYYSIYDKLDDPALLEESWREAIHGINNIIEVYGMGKRPLYPAIDSVSYDVRSERYGRLVTIAYQKDTQLISTGAFPIPAMEFALDLLEINNRDEAARFEPLERLENKAAANHIGSIKWNSYPFSIILVPGAGNDLPNVPLAAWGKMRLDIAVDRYRSGQAPIIAVSGGYVHPFQTPYCEALEMKRYLMSRYQIPEKAIIIDPHARHTTTNIRNVNRMIYKYGIPFTRQALIVTDPNQSLYIESALFSERCKKEIKSVPFSTLTRKSSFELAYLPMLSALYINSMDPLDP